MAAGRHTRPVGRMAAILVVLGAALAFPAPAAAEDTTINFDDHAAGTQIANQYAGEGVTFGERANGTPTPSPYIETPPAGQAHSSPNVLDISAGCGSEFPHAELWGRFASPRNHVRLFVGNVYPETIAPTQQVKLQGYDLGGKPIPWAVDTVSFTGFGVQTEASITDSESEIAFFSITSGSPTFCPVAIDDLSFDEVPGAIPPDFGISIEGSADQLAEVTLAPGGSAHLTLDLHRTSTSTGPISFDTAGMPTGVQASLSPNPTYGGDGSKISLTLTAAANAPPIFGETVPITAEPSPTAGTKVHRVYLTIVVAAPYDLRAQGIEVTQGIQDEAAVLVPSGAASGGSYAGLDLVAGKHTAVRFFADAHGSPLGVRDAVATLRGFRNGFELGGSPLHAVYGPELLEDTGEPDPAPVYAAERTHSDHAFTFDLPPTWTKGTLRLVAQVSQPLPGFNGQGPECSASACKANNTFEENGIAFNRTQKVTLNTIALTENGESPVPASVPTAAGKLVAPLSDEGFVILPYQANVDITDIVNSKDSYWGKTGAANARVYEWAADNGLPNYATMGIAAAGIGGLTEIPTSAVVFNPDSESGDDRPYTGVAHEMFHLFTLKHASRECGGGQDNDSDDIGQLGTPWPLKPGEDEDKLEEILSPEQKTDEDRTPDEGFGQLLGVGLDMSRTPYRVLADGNVVSRWFDFMSYCTPIRGYGDAGNWLSPINWEAVYGRFALASGSSARRLRGAAMAGASARRRPSGAVAAIHPGRIRVIGYAGADGFHISSVGAEVGPPLPRGTSSYTLEALGGRGQVLASAPMHAGSGHVDQVGPIEGVTGEIPARGAAQIEVVSDGAVVASRRRPRHRPRVRVLAPRRGTRVAGRGRVRVSWRTSGTPRRPLRASVDYSRDGGRHWRTLFIGPDRGRAALPAFYLAASRRARVRVRINDGFDEAAAVSAPFAAAGAAPKVTIERPLARVDGDARLALAGQAIDQDLRALHRRRLRWFDGPFPLGRGAEISAGPLPPGKNRIRLAATDAAGRTGTAHVTVKVQRVNLPFLKLRIPKSVPRSARQLSLRATSAIPAKLSVDGHMFRLKARRRARVTSRIRIPIRRGAPLLLRLAVTAEGAQTPFAAVVRRR